MIAEPPKGERAPLAVALAAIGAVAYAQGTAPPSLTGMLILTAAFYGAWLVLRSRAALALVFAPPVAWSLAAFWTFLPKSVNDGTTRASLTIYGIPGELGYLLLAGATIAIVVLMKPRIGAGLVALTVATCGFSLFMHFVMFLPLENATPIIQSMAWGYRGTSQALVAICWLLFAVGPVTTTPLPRKAGAILGAIGAVVLAAVLTSTPEGHRDIEVLLPAFAFFVALILVAVGLGAIARAGAGAVGWGGLGLVVLQIFALPIVLLMLDKAHDNGASLALATPFMLLGLAITAVKRRADARGADAFPRVAAVAALLGTAIVVQTWMGTLMMLSRAVASREPPFGVLREVGKPAIVWALAIWAAYLVFAASPPRPAESDAIDAAQA